MPDAIAYLITFRTHGTWLHGDDRGSVDRDHNVYGTELLAKNERLRSFERSLLESAPTKLNSAQRLAVTEAIEGVVRHRHWTLRALNVRSNHEHVVIEADATPEHAMNTFKSWATRRPRECGLIPNNRKVWARHGSTRYFWKQDEVLDACEYVAEGQGDDLP